MEFLDIYDEDGNHLGTKSRSDVHRDALWHKTVHCWLYDKMGNVYFQIRAQEGTLYTTASGHILAGETVKEGFGREIKEEIGISVNIDNCILVDVVKFVMDRENKDGSLFRDRAFANVYICDFEEDYQSFHFDKNEIKGLVKMKAAEVLTLLKEGSGSLIGTVIKEENGVNISKEQTIYFEDFLVNNGETAFEKYGDVLRKIIVTTEKKESKDYSTCQVLTK